MRKLLVGIGVVIASLTGRSHAQAPVVLFGDDETPSRWLVELSSLPSIDGTAQSTLDREESDCHRAARATGLRHSGSRRFRELWNGLAITTTRRDLSRLRGFPGVQVVYPVRTVRVNQREEPPGYVTGTACKPRDLVVEHATNQAIISRTSERTWGRRGAGRADRRRARARWRPADDEAGKPLTARRCSQQVHECAPRIPFEPVDA